MFLDRDEANETHDLVQLQGVVVDLQDGSDWCKSTAALPVLPYSKRPRLWETGASASKIVQDPQCAVRHAGRLGAHKDHAVAGARRRHRRLFRCRSIAIRQHAGALVSVLEFHELVRSVCRPLLLLSGGASGGASRCPRVGMHTRCRVGVAVAAPGHVLRLAVRLLPPALAGVRCTHTIHKCTAYVDPNLVRQALSSPILFWLHARRPADHAKARKSHCWCVLQ